NFFCSLSAHVGEVNKHPTSATQFVKYLIAGQAYASRFFKLKSYNNPMVDPNRRIRTVLRLGMYLGTPEDSEDLTIFATRIHPWILSFTFSSTCARILR